MPWPVLGLTLFLTVLRKAGKSRLEEVLGVAGLLLMEVPVGFAPLGGRSRDTKHFLTCGSSGRVGKDLPDTSLLGELWRRGWKTGLIRLRVHQRGLGRVI